MTHSELPAGYDLWRLAGPEEPSKYVLCHTCKCDVRHDDCVLVNDEYYCDACTKCTCGQLASSRCPNCSEWTCGECLLSYDYGMDPETGYRDSGEWCKRCAEQHRQTARDADAFLRRAIEQDTLHSLDEAFEDRCPF